MKKILTDAKKWWQFSVLSVLTLGLLACSDHVGLGDEVDLTAPRVKITSHEDNDTVPGGFTLEGTAYDNEQVTKITIDCDDADLHYQVAPGGSWQKKTATSATWTSVEGADGTCVASETEKNTWHWAIYIDTSEKASEKTDATFSFTIIADDKNGNSSNDSKADCSLIVDEKDPDVTIYKPELFTGTYDAVAETTKDYALQDGNVIAKLLNGDLTFSGRQTNSIEFEELRIEFDNGMLSSGTARVTDDDHTVAHTTAAIAENVSLGDEANVTTYYTKTLKVGEDGIVNLRNWEITVPASAWVSQEKNPELQTGKHIIRIVTTSVSQAKAWQRKVVGYFVWWQEADTPWITTYVGDDVISDEPYSVYPGSHFSGTAQDDDGIQSLSYTITKQADDKSFDSPTVVKTVPLSEEGTKYSAWSFNVPAENALYKLDMTVTDVYGASSTLVKYFKTLDVSPPSIAISAPENGGSVLEKADGTITFTGTVSDDGTIQDFVVVHLNPALSDDPQNKIKYLSGNDSNFARAAETGYTDENGNVVYKIALGEPEYSTDAETGVGKNVYAFTQQFSLFESTDSLCGLGIDGTTRLLEAQDFVFRAVDNNGSNTVQTIMLLGDSEAPSVEITKVALYHADAEIAKETTVFDGSEVLPKILAGDYAVVTGTWSDNSTAIWGDATKINAITLNWLEAPYTITQHADGTWEARVSNVPTTSSVCTVSLTDFGGNTKTNSRSIFVETADVGLERIGAQNDDGAYKTGDIITIALEFTKNTNVTGGVPTLTLNNGKTAVYASGDGTATHTFTYQIADGDDIATLDVTAINANGATWKDSAETAFDVLVPTVSSKRLGGTRNICIDTTAPAVKSITAITPAGAYKADASIILLLEFTENVTLTQATNIALSFDHALAAGNSLQVSPTGSKYVLFTYTVQAGENANPLTLGSLTGEGVTVTDEAGNTLTSWALPSMSLNHTIVVDTTQPDKPTVTKYANWTSDGEVVFDDDGTGFTVSGESGAAIEYTIDGTNFQKYSTDVVLKNNGTYRIQARQTDAAGNVSELSEVTSVTVDKGALLTRITADTVNGTYSTNTATKAIMGRIVFRKSVTLPQGASVTLNVANNASTAKQVPLTECVSASATNTHFTFTYAITDGDAITAEDGILDVTDWSFAHAITFEGKTISLPVPAVGSGKRFNENREIKVLTGVPSITDVSLDGEGADAVLTITFDREIAKNAGNITFTQDTSNYRVPAVLTASEYAEILSVYPSLKDYYTAGVNGATLNSDHTLTNDTATKYILNFDKNDTDSALISAFTTTAKKHIISIPVVASAVTASGKTMTVRLGTTYKLPVKGATYTLVLPANMAVDAVQNNNTRYEKNMTANGVEAPTIRIKKNTYTISGAGNTKTATVTMPDTAKMRMECRTPGATITYGLSQTPSSTVHVNKSPLYFETATTTPSVPTNLDQTYDEVQPLGSTVTKYDDAIGMKFAIAAQAQKNGTASETAYEYATRTVLKFVISGNYESRADSKGEASSNITENGSKLTFSQLRVWIIGGDSAYGGNTISTFPLAWADSSKFKLMDGKVGNIPNDTTDMHGQWYWVTWDISAPTYHGFVIGDVPSDAATNGPTKWYAAECAWVAQKENYVLYPGETLEMAIESSNGAYYQANFLFRLKNEGTR